MTESGTAPPTRRRTQNVALRYANRQKALVAVIIGVVAGVLTLVLLGLLTPDALGNRVDPNAVITVALLLALGLSSSLVGWAASKFAPLAMFAVAIVLLLTAAVAVILEATLAGPDHPFPYLNALVRHWTWLVGGIILAACGFATQWAWHAGRRDEPHSDPDVDNRTVRRVISAVISVVTLTIGVGLVFSAYDAGYFDRSEVLSLSSAGGGYFWAAVLAFTVATAVGALSGFGPHLCGAVFAAAAVVIILIDPSPTTSGVWATTVATLTSTPLAAHLLMITGGTFGVHWARRAGRRYSRLEAALNRPRSTPASAPASTATSTSAADPATSSAGPGATGN